MVANVCAWRRRRRRHSTVAPLETTSQCGGAVTRDVEGGLQVGLVEAREHPLGVGGFELRVQVHLAVDRVDEAVQPLAGVGVAAVGVDDHDVAFGQAGQRDAGGFVVAGHVDVATVEGGAADGVGGDVDVRCRRRPARRTRRWSSSGRCCSPGPPLPSVRSRTMR